VESPRPLFIQFKETTEGRRWSALVRFSGGARIAGEWLGSGGPEFSWEIPRRRASLLWNERTEDA
jgi:hypothetical protein